jgi:hypothetical protein
MPATEDGTNKLLNFFLYGMLRASESLGNPQLFLRSVIEAGLRRFLFTDLPAFGNVPEDPTKACEAFTKAADASGLLDGRDTTFRSDGDGVSAEIGDHCPYRRLCTVRHDEGRPIHCVRASMLAEMLRIRLDADLDPKLNRFGRPCQITLTPSRWKGS